jgi:hypothetical protein
MVVVHAPKEGEKGKAREVWFEKGNLRESLVARNRDLFEGESEGRITALF